jgi:LysM repeat protein
MFNKPIRPLLLAVGLCLSTSSFSQNPATHLPYQVRAGDTLLNIIARYLQPNVSVRQLQSLNGLRNPNLIGVGQTLLLPRESVRTTFAQARVSQVRCDHAMSVRGSPVVPGMVLQENDEVSVPAGCSVAMVLDDGSVLTVPSGGELVFQRLRSNPLETTPDVRTLVRGGRVQVSVNEEMGRTAPFEMSTPKVVMGVRGTEFRTAFEPLDEQSLVEVLQGKVATGQKTRPLPAGRGQGFGRSGHTEIDEALLPPPVPRFVSTTGPQWRLSVRTSHLTQKLLSRNSLNATFSDLPSATSLNTSDLPMSAPSGLAVFYEWVAVSASGLHGMPGRYGLCSYSSAGCNVVFVSPLTSSAAQRLRLQQLDGSYDESVTLAGGGFFDVPTLVMSGLRAGRYKWQFSVSNGSSHAGMVQQSGEFILLEAPAAR